MREYELVEIKLSVAMEEGCAAHGPVPDAPWTRTLLFPGVHRIALPTPRGAAPCVVLTEEHDVGFLGLDTGPALAAVVIHARDVEWMQQAGLRPDLARFHTNGALEGWYFAGIPWGDEGETREALTTHLGISSDGRPG